MFDLDTWQEIFESISKHRMRSILTALGVSWGIFMLVFLLGSGQGLQNGVEYQFRDDAVNSIRLFRGRTSKPYKGLAEGRRIRFTNADYKMLAENYEDIDQITGRFYLSGERIVKYNDQKLSFSIRSVHPGHRYLENSEMMTGRYLNDSDLDQFRKVAVIGKIVEEKLFKDENPLGKFITIGDASFKVVGTYEDSGGENEMRIIYIPITTAQKIYGGSEDIHQLMFTTNDLSIEETKELEDEIRMVMAQTHKFDPNDRRAVNIFNLAEEYEKFQSLFAMIRIFVWFVGIGSIIAGVIGVSNIMLIVVKERTKEIGIRKALGATPSSIVGMILQESIFITALAGYLGLVAGIMVLYGMQSMEVDYFRNPQVNIWVGVQALFVLVACGALAGLIPARKAANIDPIKAMRT
jgi:putative ABC transport system permease protein